ncbi:hypothetical protein BV898_09754 [Hypsibius exemplaris]|uniref:HTH CENPB-type domain-containing protein n=1 Tax=Hypsibius exemplaris TaxID=2072580 RepID=A0A1W0WLP6_HYPEX|nr:hypothetical protein BV898_09754 [Hypsibius exemplaris]
MDKLLQLRVVSSLTHVERAVSLSGGVTAHFNSHTRGPHKFVLHYKNRSIETLERTSWIDIAGYRSPGEDWKELYQPVDQSSCLRNEANPVAIKRRGAEHPELEKELASWVLEGRSVGLKVSGSDIPETALEIAKRDNVAEFRASVGWLVNFKKRHRLS